MYIVESTWRYSSENRVPQSLKMSPIQEIVTKALAQAERNAKLLRMIYMINKRQQELLSQSSTHWVVLFLVYLELWCNLFSALVRHRASIASVLNIVRHKLRVTAINIVDQHERVQFSLAYLQVAILVSYYVV